MTKLIFQFIVLTVLSIAAASADGIDPNKVLFGVEYTFQDREMVNEPGRMTTETPHKRKKFDLFLKNYLNEFGLTRSATTEFGSAHYKPGVTFEYPGDGTHVVNMEPVTIEVNTPPRKIHEIEASAAKIFRAAERAQLVPYVNPAAERSGMGHVHVGGRSLADSPFFTNPALLRNTLVYFHKHPALLYGFAEAYDIGDNSNIETYHLPKRQDEFEKAVKEFDEWYLAQKKQGLPVDDGLEKFIKILARNDRQSGFFQHYRFINLEHLKALRGENVDPKLPGKLTVEFRGFRPPASPQMARANAELLTAVMEHLAKPGHLEPFEKISEAAAKRFYTAGKVADDWEKVKKDLPRSNSLWDQSIREYVDVQERARIVRFATGTLAGMEVYPAYSEKTLKGTAFEIRIPATGSAEPVVKLSTGESASFEKVTINQKPYWISHFEAKPSWFSTKECENFFSLVYSGK